MGAQGCGKGTQAKRLQQDCGLVHISIGDIFRWHIESRTKLGESVKRRVDSGQLVADTVVEDLVRRRLIHHDWNYGFVLDGFPRNEHQAEFLLENYDVDAVIYIDVPDDVTMERILARRLCAGCGKDYNLKSRPPAESGVCDVCGGKLKSRPDDTPDAVAHRLKEYRERTEPIVQLLARKERICKFDGNQSAEAVHDQIMKALGLP